MPAVAWLRQNTIGSVAAGSVSNRSAWSSPSAALWSYVVARSSKSDVIMPAPTAQPQRVAVSGVGPESRRRETPAPPRRARSGASGSRTCRSFRRNALVIAEILDLRGDAHGKAARIEKTDGRAAAAAGEKRVPRRGDVVADRRDEADAGDGDASLHRTGFPRACPRRDDFEPRGGGDLVVHSCRQLDASRSIPAAARARRRCRAWRRAE